MTTTPMTSEEEKMSTVIETWKLDLERLLWSYHENGRPDGKTGVIGNPKTIEEFVIKLMNEQYHMGKKDGLLAERERVVEMCEEMKYKYRHTHDIQTVDGKYQCLLCGTPLKEMAPILTQNEKRYCPHPKSYNKALSDLKTKIEEEL